MSGPLTGVRVLDLTTVVMGPYATQILADLGADVIKVEPPGGDVMRYAWPFRNPGMGHIFLNANRNKRSIVLDLKQTAAHEACLALAKKADVLVYNIRPQAMARLRLAYEDLRAVNPRIIYVGCFGYSQRGPYAAKAAYDDLIQGAAGVPWLLKKQGADTPRYAPLIIADRAIGYFRTVEHPSEGRVRSMAVPSEWSDSPPEYRRHAPRLGEHTREVLAEV